MTQQPYSTLLRGHLPALDGLRGLAIAMVMFCHFLPYGDHPGSALGKLVFLAGRTGAVGVDLFFVLSGFLITGILLEARGKPHYFRDFYARRTLRIFPLYYFVLLVAFVILPLLWANAFSSDKLQEIRHRQAWLWCYGANLLITRLNDFPFHAAWANFNPFWSLAVEEHFYLIWPAIVYLCRRRALAQVCLVYIAVAFLARWSYWHQGKWAGAYVFTLSRMDALALGGLLAIAMRSSGQRVARLLRCTPWVLAAALIIALASIYQSARAHAQDDGDSLLRTTVGTSAVAIFFGALLIQCLTARRGSLLQRASNAGWLRMLGKYSYGLYVYHTVLGGAYESLFGQRRLQGWLADHLRLGHAAYGLSILLYMGLATAATLAVAMLSWHLFEKQFLKFKRYFEYDRPAPVVEPVASGA